MLCFEGNWLPLTCMETYWEAEEQYGLQRIKINQWNTFKSNKGIIRGDICSDVQAYEPNAVRSMHLERRGKYFPYGPSTRSIKSLLYTSLMSFTILERCPGSTPIHRVPLSQYDCRSLCDFR